MLPNLQRDYSICNFAAAVDKLVPIREEILNVPDLLMIEKQKRKKDLNENITSLLQYFRDNYDDSGKTKAKKTAQKASKP